MQQPPRFPLSSRTQPPSFPESKVAEVPVRILIEARQLDIRDMMASHLRSLGYECKIAETPGDAMETIESGEKFDLVCCDLASWPEEKFWHLQRGKTHVLASIAVYDTVLIEKLLQNWMFDFLLKPFTPELLTTVVRRGLERNRLLMENLFLKNWVGLGSGIDIPRMAYEDHL